MHNKGGTAVFVALYRNVKGVFLFQFIKRVLHFYAVETEVYRDISGGQGKKNFFGK